MRRRAFLIALASVMVATACGDSTGPDSIVGVYTLQTINGQTLPVTVLQDATGRLEITGGRVSLNGDGTFSDAADIRVTSGADVLEFTESAVGTYVRNGNIITFNATDGPYEMTISGRTLTQDAVDFIFVYRR